VMLSNETYNYIGQPTQYSVVSGISNANQQQYSTYGSLGIPLTSSLTLAGSARLLGLYTEGQFPNAANTAFNPETSQSQHLTLGTIGLSDALNQQTKVYVRRAMGYQLPFIDQSSLTGSAIGNFGLKVTTSTAYETGLNWKGEKIQFNTEAFLTNLNNEIAYFQPPNGFGYNYNLPETRREGLAFDGQYQPDRAWTLGTSFTLMRNHFIQGANSGDEIPGASNILSNVNARYQVNPIWSVYGESQYVSSEYAQGDNANAGGEIPGYCLFNAAVNAELSAGWLLSFRIDNLTNHLYYLATYYSPSTGDSAASTSYYPAAGRTFLVSLSYGLR
jgi:outer membrane receptor protein involved in Fe transport